MKKLALMIAVILMAFTTTFAQERQHSDHNTRYHHVSRHYSYHRSRHYVARRPHDHN